MTDSSVPLPPGLEAIRLSQEEADAIRAILDDEAHPAHEGREMPTADPSVLMRDAR